MSECGASGQAMVIAVATSGGRDSTALLHATARAARGTGLQVVALHVHHGLNPAADEWLAHLEGQCRRWSRAGLPVALRATRLQGAPAAGESIEAWARRERYRALSSMAREARAGIILLAHHRRDQAETVLLQALRGAGPAGLSAMPRATIRDGIHWCRPWLQHPAEAIAAYVKRHRLSHVEDDSNLDRRFDRNRLRHDVWPALLAGFPRAESAFLHLAEQAQWARQLIDEVAQSDVAAALATADGGLDAGVLLALTPARRVAALRHWLAESGVTHGLDGIAGRVAREMNGVSAAQWPVDAVREARLYRGRLTLVERHAVAAGAGMPREEPVPVTAGRHELPAWGGVLEITPVSRGGVSLGLLEAACLRARRPGDRFQFAPRSAARSLKKQYQDRAVAAWERSGPIVAAGERIVFVPGLGIDARAWATPDEPQFGIHWLPDR